MKSKSLKIAIAFCSFFLSINISLAFDDLTTHPALTDEIVDFHNLFSANKITPQEKELIVSGAMGEDIPPRWINHFYDPVRNIGWTGRNTGIWPTSLVRYFSGTVLSSAYPVSSLNWLHNQELQTYYKMYQGNRTWERAVYEYANGNPEEALRTLGYVLHLIEDAAVPDHTRDDPHAHDMRLATGDYGSPLEEYAKRYNRNNFNIADELKNNGYKPIALSSVDDHLVSLAKYSNGYFFSKDTINDPVYQNPKIVKEDGKFGYGKDKDGEEFELVKVTKKKIRVEDEFKEIKEYFLLENRGEEVVVGQYFTRLSREAIIHGAGVVDLFFKEAEAIKLGQKEAPKLFVEENKSVVQRIIALDAGLGNFSATGEFFKIVNFTADIYKQAKEKIFAIAADIANLFSSKLNGGLSAALQSFNLINSENNTDSSSSASDTDHSQPATLTATENNSNLPAETEKMEEADLPINQNVQHSMSNIIDQDKFKQVEESFQVWQSSPSRTVLDGEDSPELISAPNLPALPEPETIQPKENSAPISFFEPPIMAITKSAPAYFDPGYNIPDYEPGFGGGGSGAVENSSASSASSASSSGSSSESSSASSSSSSDTTPPVLSSLAILECQTSLSSDGCLVATTTLNIAWNSLADDLDYFIINNNGAVSATTSTSTVAIASDNAVFSFAVSARDLTGNFSATSTQTAEISTRPVVINEVAWAGNSAAYSADEWIELYNRTSQSVNLSNWILYSKTDLSPYASLSGTIPSRGYYLLERTRDDTVSNLTADKIYTGDLVNNGENLALTHKPPGQATTTIDEIPYDTYWYAGSDYSYLTMERYDPDIAGTIASNWGTNNGIIRNGHNAGGGNINGTPKARNSYNYLINRGGSVSSDLTLSASSSPYLVDYFIQTFNASSTLTIEPGVVIKFNNNAGLSFGNGAKILAQGTADNPIVFTSFDDDTYGGDTNGDAASTTPYWGGVRIDSPGAESVISNAVFRYGGRAWTDGQANLHIANSSAVITNSIFEYSKIYGARLSSASTTFSGNIFRHNNNSEEGSSTGLYAELGNLTANSNSFSNNRRGLYIANANSTSVNSNTFTSNTNEAIYSSGQLGSYSNNSGSSNGVNAISLNGTIASNGATTTLLANSLPYLLSGTVFVAASSTLAINSGLTLKGWSTGATSYLDIYGRLVVSGANFSDIVFGALSASPAKGLWGGLRLYPGSYSAISGATFESANTAIAYTGSPINLANVKFNENNLGVSADAASRAYPVSASGVTFTGNTATTSPGLW